MNAQVKTADPKNIRLAQSMFIYIAACLKDGDLSAIRRLRIRPDQTSRFLKITATDLLELAESGIDCVSIDVDPDALDDVFAWIEQRRIREDLIQRCIKRDAPSVMMREFFGLSRHRYSKCRAALDMPASPGRSAQPTQALEADIYRRWQAHGERWSARHLLEIADAIDASLRSVWDVLGRFPRMHT